MSDASATTQQRANALVVADKPKQLGKACLLQLAGAVHHRVTIHIEHVELVSNDVKHRLKIICLLWPRDDATQPHSRELHAHPWWQV